MEHNGTKIDSEIRLYFDATVSMYYCPVDETNSKLINVTSNDVSKINQIGFFKCAGIEKSTGKYFQCQFTTNVRSEFSQHVRQSHKYLQMVCVYCSDLEYFKQVKLFQNAISLVLHQEKCHSNLNYQCNLCPYRSLTPDHVNIHQLTRHQHYPRSERMILCYQMLKKPDLSLKQFYDFNRVEKLKDQSDKYQCLYCEQVFLQTNFHDLIVHQVKCHPDFPMLFYLPEIKQQVVTEQELLSETEIPEPNIENNYLVDDLLTDDDSENQNPNDQTLIDHDYKSMEYCCFFCSSKLENCDSLRIHTILHLFDSLNNEQRNEFFNNWIDWFISSQNMFQASSEQEYYPECPICMKLSSPDPKTLPDPAPSSRQRIHYILHSGYKPLKCLLCQQEQRGQFWLPEIVNLITKHLNEFHRNQLNECNELKTFDYLKHIPKFNDWPIVKQKLQNVGFIEEFSTRNQKLMDGLDKQNQNALKTLEMAYLKCLDKFRKPGTKPTAQKRAKFKN